MKTPLRLSPDQVPVLLERFFDGATTNAEEQALYAFFRQPDLPARWAEYRPLFAYFESGLAAEPLVAPEASTAAPPPAVRPRRRRLWMRVAAVAAGVVLLVGSGWTYSRHLQHEQWEARYGGSYRIEHGRRITDLRRLMPYIRQAEAVTAAMERHAFAAPGADERQMRAVEAELTRGLEDPQLKREIENLCATP